MKNYPFTMQDERNDSGPCCLKMLLMYYGIDEDLMILKNRTHTTSLGTPLKAMIDALNSYEIESEVKEVALEDLKQEKLPCILVMNDGYVVLYEMKKKLVIASPKQGLISLTMDDLDGYDGQAILVTHFGRYYDYHKATFKEYKKEICKEYRHEIHHLMGLNGLIVLLLGVIVFGLLYLKKNMPMALSLYLLLGMLCFLVFILCFLFASQAAKKRLRCIAGQLDERHVLVPMKKLILQNPSYFYEGEDVVASRIEELHDLSLSLTESMSLRGSFVGLALLGAFMIFLSYGSAMIFGLYMIFLIIMNYYYGTFKNQDGMNEHTLDQYLLARSSYAYAHDLFMSLNAPVVIPYEHSYREKHNVFNQYVHKLDAGKISLVFLYFLSNLTLLVLTRFHLLSFNLYALCGSFVFITGLTLLCAPFLQHFVKMNEDEMLYERYKIASVPVELTGATLDSITKITLRNVSISYGGEDVLSHIDGALDHSCLISGKGMTTLFKCLSGTHFVVHGHIFYNNVNYNALSRKVICDHVYDVRPVFINGTIKENLFCEDEARIKEVLEHLGASTLFNALEKPMSRTGAPLSSHEQVLLLIARALLAKQEVLLFDRTFDIFSDEEAFQLMSELFEIKDRLILITTSKTVKKDCPHVVF